MRATPHWDTLQDDTAFQQFYETFRRVCHRATRRRYLNLCIQWSISSTDYEEMVADAVVDSFLALRPRWGAPDLDSSRPLALLVTMAQRRLLRRLQGALRQVQHRAKVSSLDLPPVVTEDATTRTAVIDVLGRLHPRQAQALQGHYLEDRSLCELAGTLATTEAGLKCLLQRGRSRFRTLWHEEEGQPAPGGIL